MAKKEKPPKPPKPPKAKKGKKGEAEKIAADAEDSKIAPPEGAEGEGGEGEAPAKKKLAGKTLVLFIILPALLLLGGGGAAAYFLMFANPPAEHAEAVDAHGKPVKKKEAGAHGEKSTNPAITEGEGVYYYAMPEMLVNITSGDGRPVYLKLKLTLEAPDQDVAESIEPQLPRVTDQFQAFLRELRVDDLAGSAGAYRLRLELLRRVNLAVAPSQINAVLIEEMLVQ